MLHGIVHENFKINSSGCASFFITASTKYILLHASLFSGPLLMNTVLRKAKEQLVGVCFQPAKKPVLQVAFHNLKN